MPKTKRGHHSTKASARPKPQFMLRRKIRTAHENLGQGVRYLDRRPLPNPLPLENINLTP